MNTERLGKMLAHLSRRNIPQDLRTTKETYMAVEPGELLNIRAYCALRKRHIRETYLVVEPGQLGSGMVDAALVVGDTSEEADGSLAGEKVMVHHACLFACRFMCWHVARLR